MCGGKPLLPAELQRPAHAGGRGKKRAFLLEREKKITRLREKAGLSRAQLAEALGATQLEVYRWEMYEEEPGTALLGRIARALGCPHGGFDLKTEPALPGVKPFHMPAGRDFLHFL